MDGLGSDKKEKQLFLSKVSQLQWHYSQRFAECCPRSFSTWLAISSTTPSRKRCQTVSGLTSWRSKRTMSRSWRWRRTTTAPWTIRLTDDARHNFFLKLFASLKSPRRHQTTFGITASTKCSTQDEGVKTLGTSDQVDRSNYVYMIMVKAFWSSWWDSKNILIQRWIYQSARTWPTSCSTIASCLRTGGWKASLVFFSCPRQLKRWYCHSLTESVSEWPIFWFERLQWKTMKDNERQWKTMRGNERQR